MKNNKISLYLLIACMVMATVGIIKMSKTNSCKLIPREVIFGNKGRKLFAQISPDGKFIIYNREVNSVMNVWLKTVGKNDDKPITFDSKRGIFSYFWSWDSKSIFYLQDVAGNENRRLYSVELATGDIKDYTPFENVQVRLLNYSKNFPHRILLEINKREPKIHDIYELNTEANELKLIHDNSENAHYWVADNNLIVRAKVLESENGDLKLLVRNSTEDAWRILGTWSADDASPNLITQLSLSHFSLDGIYLFLTDARNNNTKRFVKININSGEIVPLAQDNEYDVEGTVLLDYDTLEPLALRYFRDRPVWKYFDTTIEKTIEELKTLDSGELAVASRSLDNNHWIIYFSKDNGPISYWYINRITGQNEFLFHHQSNLNDYKLSPMEPISFIARDDMTIHGYITYPCSGQKTNIPLIVLVHGGPWSRDVWSFNFEAQWLANRGYAVLQVNFRGSTGYGKAFLNAGNKQWGQAMQNDITDAVQWAISNGLADPKHIAIYGASYGGYVALVGATFTPELYACAVDIFGPSNLITCLNAIPPYWSRSLWYNRVGNPETEQEFLESISPLFKVQAITIPMLIAHGANDPRVKQAESEQIVAEMKAKGIDVEYILFMDEGHGFVRQENKLVFYEAVEKFFAKYLGGRYEQ